jgi:hypothetical protein
LHTAPKLHTTHTFPSIREKEKIKVNNTPLTKTCPFQKLAILDVRENKYHTKKGGKKLYQTLKVKKKKIRWSQLGKDENEMERKNPEIK